VPLFAVLRSAIQLLVWPVLTPKGKKASGTNKSASKNTVLTCTVSGETLIGVHK
jgi:hypothetical protein